MEEQNYNNNQNQPAQPTEPVGGHQQQPETPEKKGGFGPIAGITIIIILLVLGGLYFWGAQLNNQAASESAVFDSAQNDDIASQSDEPESIEGDLDDFNSAQFEAELEAELNAIESEL